MVFTQTMTVRAGSAQAWAEKLQEAAQSEPAYHNDEVAYSTG